MFFRIRICDKIRFAHLGLMTAKGDESQSDDMVHVLGTLAQYRTFGILCFTLLPISAAFKCWVEVQHLMSCIVLLLNHMWWCAITGAVKS